MKYPHVINTAAMLVEGAKILGVPVFVTEQYPKGLGHTVSEISVPQKVYEKTQFSMLIDEIRHEIQDIDQIVLFGIEAHVCVLQTTLDLLENGKQVFLVADGISSSRSLDRAVALDRMQRAGATLTTSESVLFEFLQSKDHPNFRVVQGLVKEFMKKIPDDSRLWLAFAFVLRA